MAKQEVAKTTERQQQSALQMIEQKLQAAPNLKAALNMGFVQDRFIADYKASSGRDDGKAKYMSEVLAYMEIINDKPDLAAADRWQHFAAIVKVGRMGLSLRGGGDLYVMPGKNKTIVIQSTPAGKRKQMEAMKEIKRFPEAQLVMVGDIFVYDKLNGIITKHEVSEKSHSAVKLENIKAAYQRIYWTDRRIDDVVVPIEDLLKAKAKSPAQSEVSFWATYPGEACKKVASKRAHRLYHKYPDGLMDLGVKEEEEEDTQDVQHTNVDFMPSGDKVDTDTGEVVEEAKVVDDKPKPPQDFM